MNQNQIIIIKTRQFVAWNIKEVFDLFRLITIIYFTSVFLAFTPGST